MIDKATCLVHLMLHISFPDLITASIKKNQLPRPWPASPNEKSPLRKTQSYANFLHLVFRVWWKTTNITNTSVEMKKETYAHHSRIYQWMNALRPMLFRTERSSARAGELGPRCSFGLSTTTPSEWKEQVHAFPENAAHMKYSDVDARARWQLFLRKRWEVCVKLHMNGCSII